MASYPRNQPLGRLADLRARDYFQATKTTKTIVTTVGGIAVVGMVLDGAELCNYCGQVPIDLPPLVVPSSAPSISTILHTITGEEIPVPSIVVVSKFTPRALNDATVAAE